MTGRLGPSQKDTAATPVATSLGLPNVDPEPQPSPFQSVAAPGLDTILATPVTQSPSTSIASLSDFTIADASGDESPVNPTIADASDDEPPLDPTTITLHGTFYIEDGNVEVVWQHVVPHPRWCLAIPLSCTWSDVRERELGYRGITQRLSPHFVF